MIDQIAMNELKFKDVIEALEDNAYALTQKAPALVLVDQLEVARITKALYEQVEHLRQGKLVDDLIYVDYLEYRGSSYFRGLMFGTIYQLRMMVLKAIFSETGTCTHPMRETVYLHNDPDGAEDRCMICEKVL